MIAVGAARDGCQIALSGKDGGGEHPGDGGLPVEDPPEGGRQRHLSQFDAGRRP